MPSCFSVSARVSPSCRIFFCSAVFSFSFFSSSLSPLPLLLRAGVLCIRLYFRVTDVNAAGFSITVSQRACIIRSAPTPDLFCTRESSCRTSKHTHTHTLRYCTLVSSILLSMFPDSREIALKLLCLLFDTFRSPS